MLSFLNQFLSALCASFVLVFFEIWDYSFLQGWEEFITAMRKDIDVIYWSNLVQRWQIPILLLSLILFSVRWQDVLYFGVNWRVQAHWIRSCVFYFESLEHNPFAFYFRRNILIPNSHINENSISKTCHGVKSQNCFTFINSFPWVQFSDKQGNWQILVCEVVPIFIESL